jgi:SAM-dependent methyltransferase
MSLYRPANFDFIARPYRWLEYITFGRALEHCRNHFLSQLAGRHSALVLGDGDGRFLAALLTSNPHLQADTVDISPAMLALLENRAHAVGARRRLHIHTSNALAFTPRHSYDLIATHFFLDCLSQPELEQLCTRITPNLTSGGLWLISDFRIPPGAMRLPARILVRLLYLGFRLLADLRTTTLPDHAAALTSAGLTRIAQHHSLGGVLSTELWQHWSKPQASQEYTSPMLPPQRSKAHVIDDPVPDPEPATPSLPEPDPGVFHHQPGDPPPDDPEAPAE